MFLGEKEGKFLQRIWQVYFTFIILFFLSACVLTPKGRIAPQGQVLVYLQAEGPPTYEIDILLEQVWLEDKDRKQVPLSLNTRHLCSLSLFTQQILLAQGKVGIGSYSTLNLKIAQAYFVKDDKKISLQIPQKVIKIPISLFITRDRTASLFLRWQPANSLQQENEFIPLINVGLGETGLKNLLLYVSNAGSNYLSVIDRGSNQVIDTITVGESPKGMALSEDANYLYVVNSLSQSISVIETTTNRVIDVIRLPMAVDPTEVVVLPHTPYLYVSAKGSNAVLVIDTISRRVVKRIEVGQGPVGLAVDAERRYVYVANSYSNNVSVIDASNNEVIRTIGVGARPCFLNSYQNYLLVANSQSDSISVIGIDTFNLLHNVFVPGGPGKIIRGLKGWFYVAGEQSNCIYFVSPNMNISPKKMPSGRKPMGMALDSDRKLLYVVNAADSDVTIYDLIRERPIGEIEVGDRPYDLVLIED